MDPITHGVIGLAISSFSGHTVSLSSPLSLGCAIGAMIPDLDVVVRLVKNEMVYLKHHRGFSHSVPALVVFSAVVTAVLMLLHPEANILQLFLWTFLGALSHTVFDILNSYGAMLFTKKRKANLLTLYDPLISVVALILIFYPRHSNLLNIGALMVTLAYLGFRYRQKTRSENEIKAYFEKDYRITDVTIMPSLKLFYKWDFVLATKTHSIVGKYNSFNGRIDVVDSLKNAPQEMVEIFKQSQVGRYFEDFTPNYHVVQTNTLKGLELKAIDLRYHFRNDFLHHATLLLDGNQKILESYFRPYRFYKKIAVSEVA